MSLQVTHNAYPVTPINYCRTVEKESDDLDILGVTFDSKMTFEKHIRSVSRAAFQRLDILRKFWRVLHGKSLLERCFRGFVVDTYIKLLGRFVSGARFQTMGVFECDIAHRRSVAVLCMLYKIRYNLMHHFYGALPMPYVLVSVTRGALVAHRYTYAPNRYKTEPRSTAVPLFSSQCPRLTIWPTLDSKVRDWRVSSAEPTLLHWLLHRFLSFTIFPFLFFLSIGWYCMAVVFELLWCRSLSLSLALKTSLNNNNNNNNNNL